MKKDIVFPEVKDICIGIIKNDTDDMWHVYLVNKGNQLIHNLMVTSRGYGEDQEGNTQKTSILRHHFDAVEPGEYVLIEPMSPDVFHLHNEYWVSFYIDKNIFDKKFIFVKGSISEQYKTNIPVINKPGILHV